MPPIRYNLQNESVDYTPETNTATVVPPVQRYTQPAPVTPTPTSNTQADFTVKTPEQFAAERSAGVDENAIRENTRKSMQTTIDAIESQYANLIGNQQKTNEANLGQTRAINARSGLQSSDFGQANVAGQRQVNDQAIKALEDEKAVKIAAVNQQIDQSVKDELAARKQDALGNAEAYSKYLSDQQAKAVGMLGDLAKSGVDLRTLDPQRKSLLLKSAYGDEGLGEIIYDSMKPKAQQTDWKFEKLSDGKGMFWGVDPTTGQPQRVEVNVDVPPDFTLSIAPDGTPLLFNKQTGEARIADGFRESQFAKAPTSDGSAPAAGENPQLYAGLSARAATAVRAQVSAFKTEQAVTNFQTVQDGHNFASSLSDTTTNPADDQALIYSLAKALDPGSVVREGEYATAQKYAQSWAKAYGKGFEQALFGTGFLSKDARQNIKKTIEQKYNASKKSYQNVYSQYSEGINNITGRSDGKAFLKNYDTTISAAPGSTSGTTSSGLNYSIEP